MAAVISFVGAVIGLVALIILLASGEPEAAATFFYGGTVGFVAGAVGVVRCWSGTRRGFYYAVAGLLIAVAIGLVFLVAVASSMPSFGGPGGTML